MGAEIRKILVCSTAHLTVATLAMLNETAAEHWGFSGNPIDHGFFLYAHDERPGYGGEAYGYRPCPDDIWALCVKARELGADYIKLDCDAEEVEGLVVYDHDAPDTADASEGAASIVIWALPYNPDVAKDALGHFTPAEAAALLGMDQAEIAAKLDAAGSFQTLAHHVERDE